MRVFCIKALGWAIVVIGVLVAGGCLVASGKWLYDQMVDPAKLDSLVHTTVAGLGGAALTFVATHLIRGKNEPAD
jgi:hypothetical protein